ncbi:glycosyltransferase [Fodinisporobacter ferrooxydans]|uniref:Glycosyltransferase n=1 Tax=Fodinisporobacter ferrooxydans TaxID=2901836 RepID=A0ABY4CH93_9BACL|nr:glycosyltransferase [Alicyclobacillaceae bacterium MYW30-H2]
MPSVSLCMIVRNEADCLRDCLESVQSVVDEIIVVDTGSTDQTLEIARQYGACCFQAEWQNDFAKMRNRSLEHATKDYILVLDADERLLPESREELRKCLETFPMADGFFVHILNQTDGEGIEEMEVSLNVRLFRNEPRYRFSAALHEQIAESILRGQPPGTIFDSKIRILHSGYLKKNVQQKQKAQRNLAIALEECKRHPGDAFRAFNLGIEYMRLQQLPQAIEAFEFARQWCKRDALWVSRFFKIYISTLMQCGNWEQANVLLTEALAIFPDYTDLYYLQGVYHFQHGQWNEALQNFGHCIQIGDPPIPPYTVEKGISTYRPYFAMGQVFQSSGRKVEAIVAYREAFQLNPRFAQAFVRFAVLLLAESADAGTLAYMEQVAAAAGENRHAWIGMALAAANHFVKAKEYLESVPDPQRVAEQLAVVYACLNEQEKLFRLLQDCDPHGAIRMQVRKHLLETGQRILETGLQRFPESEALQTLSLEYKKMLP